MQNRDWNRERRGRESENDSDWDWYYYEYYYLPYGSERRNFGDRELSRGSYRDRDRFRGNYGDRGMYGREGEYDYGSYPYSNRGRYSGVGPRGYRRSDERITDDINDRLTWHGELDPTDIQVDVNDGIVTLTGTVDDRRQKRMAEDMAESVSGVEDVNNQLKIRNRSWGRGEGEMSSMSGTSGMNRQIRTGMEVVGRDGENVGEVKEVRSNDFLVDRSMARDIYIPFSACQATGGQVRLNVRADEVDNQGWEMPELFETETSEQPKRKR